MIDKLTVTVPFNGDELYEIIKLYDILRDMDFELSETQVEVFEKLQDAEVNGGFFNGITNRNIMFWCIYRFGVYVLPDTLTQGRASNECNFNRWYGQVVRRCLS